MRTSSQKSARFGQIFSYILQRSDSTACTIAARWGQTRPTFGLGSKHVANRIAQTLVARKQQRL